MRKSDFMKTLMAILMGAVTLVSGMTSTVQADEMLGGNGEWVAAKLENEVGKKYLKTEDYKVLAEYMGYDEHSNGYAYLFDDKTKIVYDWDNSKMTMDDWAFTNSIGLKFERNEDGKLSVKREELLGFAKPESGGGPAAWGIYEWTDATFEFNYLRDIVSWQYIDGGNIETETYEGYYHDIYIMRIGYYRNTEEREQDYARYTDYLFIPEDNSGVFELLDNPQNENNKENQETADTSKNETTNSSEEKNTDITETEATEIPESETVTEPTTEVVENETSASASDVETTGKVENDSPATGESASTFIWICMIAISVGSILVMKRLREDSCC